MIWRRSLILLLVAALVGRAEGDDVLRMTGIPKRAAAGADCQGAWLLGTDGAQPAQVCLAMAALSAESRAAVESLFDQEIAVEGRLAAGALALTAIDSRLPEAAAADLDYDIAPLRGSIRSFNLGPRLRENPAGRVTIQLPPEPASVELVFQGVRMPENLPAALEKMRFRVAETDVTPEVQRFGAMASIHLRGLPAGQVLVVERAEPGALAALLADTLYKGETASVGITLLVSAL